MEILGVLIAIVLMALVLKAMGLSIKQFICCSIASIFGLIIGPLGITIVFWLLVWACISYNKRQQGTDEA